LPPKPKNKATGEMKYDRASCKNSLNGFLIVLIYLASIIGVAWLGAYICRHYSLWISAIYTCLAFIFIATRFLGLRNIVHECSHNYFVPFQKSSKNINAILGNLICSFEFTGFTKFQSSHTKHHAFLGDPAQDEDCAFFLSQTKGVSISPQGFLHKFSLYIRYCYYPLRWIRLYALSFAVPRLPYLLLNICLYTGICMILGIDFFILFCIVPYFTAYQILKLSSDYLDHMESYVPLKNKKGSLFNTKNHHFSYTILNLLFFPRNDGYHLVHHLYPRIPAKFLPSKHQELMNKNPAYAQKRHVIF
jgi:fatty acid desaturase